ncbi:MAG: hypothetical protein HC886_08290, partial [Leptolyngbyaceae cyanobacterium SM1_1_3]|nr:hypothetical protein [Leptolyngbyaceae cyanobacterium SM1_1_3]
MGAGLLIGFAFAAKAGLFPLFAWLPASYHTPSVTVSALFSALVTKVAVYALFRVFIADPAAARAATCPDAPAVDRL